MRKISKKAIADRIGYINDQDALGSSRRCVMLNDAGIWELQAPIDTRGQRLAAPTNVDIYAWDDIPGQSSATRLMLLDDSDYTYTSKTASLNQFLEIDFNGLGEVDPDDAFTIYHISLAERAIGSLSQDSKDKTWTAVPTRENVSQEKERPTVQGFAHERYAADYLQEVAARVGLLNGTEYVFELDLSKEKPKND